MDHKSLQHVLVRNGLSMRQRQRLELLNEYDCEIKYHSAKANMVADILSRKPHDKPRMTQTLRSVTRKRNVKPVRVNPIRFVGLTVINHTNLSNSVRLVQLETLKEENFEIQRLKGLVSKLEFKSYSACYLKGKT